MAEFEFEDILPFVEGEGDTGRTAREKIKRNFDKIKPLGEIPAEVQQVKREVERKLDSEPESDKFYVSDADGNIIALIDKNGISSVDFLVGTERRSLVTMIAEEILNRINADDALSVRINTLSERKLDREIDDDNLVITDNNGYIILKIDNEGVHFPGKDGGDGGSGDGSSVIDDDKIVITDNNGYIVARIDKNGVKSVKDKHAVASMVIGESFYPLSTPVRNDDGQVTSVHVMFGTGVEGNIAITYNNGLSVSATIVYGTTQYTMAINRDEDGQVTSVLVE